MTLRQLSRDSLAFGSLSSGTLTSGRRQTRFTNVAGAWSRELLSRRRRDHSNVVTCGLFRRHRQPAVQPVQHAGEDRVYRVFIPIEAGDTIEALSDATGIPAEALISANNGSQVLHTQQGPLEVVLGKHRATSLPTQSAAEPLSAKQFQAATPSFSTRTAAIAPSGPQVVSDSNTSRLPVIVGIAAALGLGGLLFSRALKATHAGRVAAATAAAPSVDEAMRQGLIGLRTQQPTPLAGPSSEDETIPLHPSGMAVHGLHTKQPSRVMAAPGAEADATPSAITATSQQDVHQVAESSAAGGSRKTGSQGAGRGASEEAEWLQMRTLTVLQTMCRGAALTVPLAHEEAILAFEDQDDAWNFERWSQYYSGKDLEGDSLEGISCPPKVLLKRAVMQQLGLVIVNKGAVPVRIADLPEKFYGYLFANSMLLSVAESADLWRQPQADAQPGATSCSSVKDTSQLEGTAAAAPPLPEVQGTESPASHGKQRRAAGQAGQHVTGYQDGYRHEDVLQTNGRRNKAVTTQHAEHSQQQDLALEAKDVGSQLRLVQAAEPPAQQLQSSPQLAAEPPATHHDSDADQPSSWLLPQSSSKPHANAATVQPQPQQSQPVQQQQQQQQQQKEEEDALLQQPQQMESSPSTEVEPLVVNSQSPSIGEQASMNRPSISSRMAENTSQGQTSSRSTRQHAISPVNVPSSNSQDNGSVDGVSDSSSGSSSSLLDSYDSSTENSNQAVEPSQHKTSDNGTCRQNASSTGTAVQGTQHEASSSNRSTSGSSPAMETSSVGAASNSPPAASNGSNPGTFSAWAAEGHSESIHEGSNRDSISTKESPEPILTPDEWHRLDFLALPVVQHPDGKYTFISTLLGSQSSQPGSPSVVAFSGPVTKAAAAQMLPPEDLPPDCEMSVVFGPPLDVEADLREDGATLVVFDVKSLDEDGFDVE